MQLAKRPLVLEKGDLDSSFDPIIKTKQTQELKLKFFCLSSQTEELTIILP